MGYYPRTENNRYNPSLEDRIESQENAINRIENIIERRSNIGQGFHCKNFESAQRVANKLNQENPGKHYTTRGNEVVEITISPELFQPLPEPNFAKDYESYGIDREELRDALDDRKAYKGIDFSALNEYGNPATDEIRKVGDQKIIDNLVSFYNAASEYTHELGLKVDLSDVRISVDDIPYRGTRGLYTEGWNPDNGIQDEPEIIYDESGIQRYPERFKDYTLQHELGHALCDKLFGSTPDLEIILGIDKRKISTFNEVDNNVRIHSILEKKNPKEAANYLSHIKNDLDRSEDWFQDKLEKDSTSGPYNSFDFIARSHSEATYFSRYDSDFKAIVKAIENVIETSPHAEQIKELSKTMLEGAGSFDQKKYYETLMNVNKKSFVR